MRQSSVSRQFMNRLRPKLILLFLAATLIPTSAILWMSVALLQHSLNYISTEDLDRLSKSLEGIAREYYRQSCEDLKKDAAAGRLQPETYPAGAVNDAPSSVRQFWESGEAERFILSEPHGDRLDYLVRHNRNVYVYAQNLNGVRMEELKQQFRRARAQVNDMRQLDLRKGLTRTLILLSAAIWVLALAGVIYLADRISRPIQDLTTGLHQLADGDFNTRLYTERRDEIGRAIGAFNHTAEHLQQNRERLVYLTQIASWQTLARKMAHELKNSLTPIRLTVEEIQARHPVENREFMDKAAQVVVEEVESLERRVRAFSEFAAEPVVRPEPLDINSLLEERVRFLEVAHPDVAYRVEKAADPMIAWADGDQVKGILANLLENAAEAAGSNGRVYAVTLKGSGAIMVEVHDSGSGLSEEARQSLFEPSISFKKRGMGLGLSISRKNALLAGGDLQHIQGMLGGAGFRLTLPISRLRDFV
jgi:two-component system, NtrC family, nitrogen regulation sensor histidine kinase NtrY